MRFIIFFVLVAFTTVHLRADDPTPKAPSQKTVQRTLVVTVFGESLYLEQLTPSQNRLEAKQKELAPAEFRSWLRTYRAARLYDNVKQVVLERYREKEKITVTAEELALISKSVEQRMKDAPKPKISSGFTPEQMKGIMVGWQRASFIDWKVCKSLYEKHGGRVGLGSMGLWVAFDAQNKLMRAHYDAGEIRFHHAEMEKAFWERTQINNFADAYPTGEKLKRYMASPPHLLGVPAQPTTSAKKP